VIDAYLARIGFSGSPKVSLESLRALHLAHARSVPFENVDIQLGLPIRLDLASLERKIVRDRRGGYCFEQNALFAAVLRALGFSVTTLAARVRWGATGPTARTHMLLEVEVEGERFLADVGFGRGVVEPLAMIVDREQTQDGDTYRLIERGEGLLLQTREGDAFIDLYAFDREPHFPVDYEVANHWTSTHPTSRFVQGLIAALPTPCGRVSLRNRTLSLPGESPREIAIEEVVDVLRRHFDLTIPRDSTFRCFAQTPAAPP